MNTFRFLNVEDNIDDSELLELELRRAGFRFYFSRVETEVDFRAALLNEHWDLIISDFSLPTFSGTKVIDIVNELNIDVPVIIVSGEVGEEIAVDTMRRGVRDFILKGRMARLIPAIKRELEEATSREQKKRAEYELEKNEEILRLAQEGARVGTWGWDVEHDQLTWSESMTQLCGFEKDDFEGNLAGLVDLIYEDDRDKFRATIEDAVEGGVSFDVEYRIRVKGGAIHWFESRGSVDVAESGDKRLLAISIDISNHIQRENELKLAKEKAEESDNLKSSFLANMSHELRTPLNAIIGFSEILRDDEISETDIRQFSDTIHQNGNHLLDLINDIVDIAHLEAGQMPTVYKDFDLNPLLVEVRNCFIAERRLLQLEDFSIDVPGKLDEPAIVYTDRVRLKQILLNLVRNAIKYTERGSIHFGYRVIDDYTLQFFVTDTGVGIPSDMQEIIFERFRQVDQSLSREFEGAGLGLSISKGLVKLLGGSIGVKSSEGNGSTFHFSLPCLRDKSLRQMYQQGVID